MKKRDSLAPPVVGGASLLIIFASLCLTVMTILMIHTATVDGRMSEVSADAVRAYYEADLEAEAILARIRNGETPEGVTALDDGCLYYECTVTETLILAVRVKRDGDVWRRITWQTYSLNR